jgi:hypothetical protein
MLVSLPRIWLAARDKPHDIIPRPSRIALNSGADKTRAVLLMLTLYDPRRA